MLAWHRQTNMQMQRSLEPVFRDSLCLIITSCNATFLIDCTDKNSKCFFLFYRPSELWLVVSRCDHLCDAVWLSSVLLEAPQSHHPEGHEKEDNDGQLWLSRRWVEPDLWDGQGHRTQVSVFLFAMVLLSCCIMILFSKILWNCYWFFLLFFNFFLACLASLHKCSPFSLIHLSAHFSFILFLCNNFSLLSSSAPCRLLKVKPEERLTIEGVLAHPWLNCTEALDNVLPSAQMMMDKVNGKCAQSCTNNSVVLPYWNSQHSFYTMQHWCPFLPFATVRPLSFPGGSRRDPAGPCRAVGQHENSGSERQPEAPKLCQQSNPQEAETTGVRWRLLRFLCHLFSSADTLSLKWFLHWQGTAVQWG